MIQEFHGSRRCSGFTLVEVVAALMVIGVALIGIAALYTESSDAARQSAPRIQAAELADRIAARIAANPAGRTGYASVVGVLCAQNAKPKRPEDAAAIEAACWHDEVERLLPSGLGSITRDTTSSPPTYVVAVSWFEGEVGAASYVIRTQSRDE